ncbi:MAG: transglutaminase domain-containing protein, partial [Bacteroidota bacterium]
LGSTQDQYDWYRGLLNDTGNERDKLQSTVDRLTADSESPEDKVESIYYWVQDNIRYVAFEQGLAGFQPENCQNVYTNKYGDCKGMANLLTEMLQMAGLDAHMTWIGTNSKVYDYSIPSLAVDNHAITTVFLEGQPHYLDATEKYIAFGDYAERIQGRPVLIEQGEDYKLAEVPKFDHQRNLTRKVFDFAVNGDELHGSIALRYNGESKVRLLSTWHSLLNENKEKAKSYLLMRGDDNVHVDEVETSDFDHRDREMSVTGQVRLRNKVFSFDGETYIDWALYQEYGDFKIDSTRVTDYQFSQKINLEKETRIKIPAGYTVKTLPENLVLDNADFNIKVDVSQANGQVVIRQQVIVPKARIRVEQIEAWNAAVEALNEKVYKRQIILVKA